MTPKENLLRAIRRQDPAWVPNGLESVVMVSPPGRLGIERRRGSPGPDCWGVLWDLQDPRVDSYPAHGGRTIGHLDRWRDEITIPDLAAEDWSVFPCGWTPAQQSVKPADLDHEGHLVCGIVEEGVFERACLLLGMEQALIAMLTDPEVMNELLACIADYKVRLIERFDEAVGLDMVFYCDDWGGQERLLVSPDTWRSLIKPHTQHIYDAIKGRGIVLNQHSCGRIEAIFGDLVEMGMDIWNFCQPCNNLAALKRQYGDQVAFQGGIDSQQVLDRPGVTIAEVRAEVRRRIDQLAAGGGYIAGPSHGVPYRNDVVQAMNEEIASYGRQVYQVGLHERSIPRQET